jgi:general secretion pathway protein I
VSPCDKRQRIGRARGFTLLEVMIAMAILSGALTWLVVGVSRNIKAENHAKLITTGTLLARQRMIDLEDELREKGFGEFEKEQTGNFEDKGFARFTWRAIVDKVELPSQEQLQTVLSNARTAQQTLQGTQTGTPTGPLGGLLGGGVGGGLGQDSSGSSSGNPLGASAGALGSEWGIIKDVLEQGIRRVTVKIGWVEGKTPQEVEVVAYYTDVRRVDQAIQLAQPPAGGAPGGGGGGGAPGGGGGPAPSPGGH